MLKILTTQDCLGTWHAYDENYCGCMDKGCCSITGTGDTKEEAIKEYKENVKEYENSVDM